MLPMSSARTRQPAAAAPSSSQRAGAGAGARSPEQHSSPRPLQQQQSAQQPPLQRTAALSGTQMNLDTVLCGMNLGFAVAAPHSAAAHVTAAMTPLAVTAAENDQDITATEASGAVSYIEDPIAHVRGAGAVERLRALEAAFRGGGRGTPASPSQSSPAMMTSILHTLAPHLEGPQLIATGGAAKPPHAAAVDVSSGPPPPLPHFTRPPPPMLPVDPAEIPWVYVPERPAPFLYDAGLPSAPMRSETRALLQRACTQALQPGEVESVQKLLAERPQLALAAGVTPHLLPGLVQYSPDAAAPFLLALLRCAPQLHAAQYMSALLTMPVSLRLLEVANQLLTAPAAGRLLPPDFLRLLVSHCCRSCEAAGSSAGGGAATGGGAGSGTGPGAGGSPGDQYLQTRLVRLVAVFLASLIRNKVMLGGGSDVVEGGAGAGAGAGRQSSSAAESQLPHTGLTGEMVVELQAFCLSFSRIKEAVALYRLLKTALGDVS